MRNDNDDKQPAESNDKPTASEQEDIATIKRLFRQRLIEALTNGTPRASTLAVIGKYLGEVGALEPPKTPPTPTLPLTGLPFRADGTPNTDNASGGKAWEAFNHVPFRSAGD